MNTQTRKKLAAIVITLATAASVTPVFAQTVRVGPQTWSVQNTVPAAGKTRAQVYAELVQARETGLIPATNSHYPADAATIERNRINFALAEQSWRTRTEVAGQ